MMISRIVLSVIIGVACSGSARAEPVLDKTVAQFIAGLKAQNFVPFSRRSPEEARDVVEKIQSLPVPLAAASIHSRFLAGGPNGRTRVQIVRPLAKDGPLPVVIYFHGGGWMMGSFKTHERLVRTLADGAGVTIVFVEYDRTPEARFPIAIEQAYAVLTYVAHHPVELNVDASRIALAGDDAGGGLATAAAMLAKKRNGPSIRSQILLYPITSSDFDDHSYAEFPDGPWLTRDDMKWFWEFYVPDRAQRATTEASPLSATIEELLELPPALVISAEHDPMREQAETYASNLKRAGVPTTMTRYSGVIHDFMMLNVFATTAAAQDATQEVIAELRSRLK